MKKIMIISAVMTAAMAIISCERYDDGRPSKDVRSEFSRMYPDAYDVEWEWEGTRWEVSFDTGSRANPDEHEAYYNTDGSWIMTKTEVLLTSVPEKIKEFLALDPEYGTASFEDNDAEYIETPSGSFYRFDLVSGGKHIHVDVNADGDVNVVK